MDQARLKYLFTSYLNNTITEDELHILVHELGVKENEVTHEIIYDLVFNIEIEEERLTEDRKNFILKQTFKSIAFDEKKQRQTFLISSNYRQWLSIAAACFLIAVISLFYLEKFNLIPTNLSAKILKEEVTLPYHKQAFLKLHDGRSLSLLDANEKTLKKEGISIQEDKNGKLTYVINEISDGLKSENTFSIPKGTSSHLFLADGTSVWLNSGASITYPTRFSDKHRKVTITGEVYFEVHPDKHRPFEVTAGKTKIRVLGTHFNVNTNLLSSEVYTTLIEGSVQIITTNNRINLSSGNQAISNEKSGRIVVSAADLTSALAWKDGYFRFTDDDIYTVLKKIEVWYDIKDFEVRSETADRFTGSVQRTNNLSDLLKQLEKVSEYKFILKGGRLIVMK